MSVSAFLGFILLILAVFLIRSTPLLITLKISTLKKNLLDILIKSLGVSAILAGLYLITGLNDWPELSLSLALGVTIWSLTAGYKAYLIIRVKLSGFKPRDSTR